MITIPLSWERPPLTTNRQPRNYAYRARIVREIQSEVLLRARSIRPGTLQEPVVVRLVWTVPDNRVRDASGPDPTLKAAQDGLVTAGLISDDRHEIVTRSYCVIEKGDKYGMRIEIESVAVTTPAVTQ